MTSLVRETRETRVSVTLARGAAAPRVATGDRFLDHMLETLARHAALDLAVGARGDLRHHLVEDVALALGEALRREIPAACARYGHRVVPMDDALVEAAIDVGGRAYWRGPLPSALYDHFLRSLAVAAGVTLHVRVRRGRDRHHVIEAAIKAVGLALRDALAEAPQPLSTKGAVRLEVDPR